MIVGINYDCTGARYVASIIFCINWDNVKKERVAQAISSDYEEVYITNFDDECEDFINEIVLHGCRIGV